MLLGEPRGEAKWRGQWRREAVVLVDALLLVAGLSWLYTRAQAGNMDVMMSMGMIMPGMERPVPPIDDLGGHDARLG